MNLKEAFRFQNTLTNHFEFAKAILDRDRNLMTTESIYLKNKASGGEAADEKVVEPIPNPDYQNHITDLVEFAAFLVLEKQRLAAAIHAAKAALPIDIDSEVSLNSTRQELAATLKHMNDLRNGETMTPNGGLGYRFNAEGNQVSYKCDVKTVRTINFDRTKVSKLLNSTLDVADARSTDIDKAIINSTVAYDAPFNVNDSFTTIFERFLTAKN